MSVSSVSFGEESGPIQGQSIEFQFFPSHTDRISVACLATLVLIPPGFQHVCYIEEYPEDKWNDMVAVMLSAPFHLTKRFIPSMKKKGRFVGAEKKPEQQCLLENEESGQFQGFTTVCLFLHQLFDVLCRLGENSEHVVSNGLHLHSRQSCILSRQNRTHWSHQGT